MRCAQLAFVFIDGQLLHAVRKEPAGWDAAYDTQPLTRLDEEVEHALDRSAVGMQCL